MCDCIELLNKELASKNTRIKIPLSFSVEGIKVLTPLIVTEKINERDRTKPISLLAAFCPFCGERYEGKKG